MTNVSLIKHSMTSVMAGVALLCGSGSAQEAPKPATTAPAQPTSVPMEDIGYREIEQLTRVMELIRQSYVDPSKVSYEQLINSALEGMLRDLDPYSQFLHPQMYQRFQLDQQATYEGVGITIEERSGAIVIVGVREDGPAAKNGLLPQDRIVKVNDQSIERKDLASVSRLLRGKPGETVKLAVQRSGLPDPLTVELMRQVLNEVTVRDVMLLPETIAGSGKKIGYLRLLEFSEPSPREIAMALDQLEDQGMQGLVLDLRNNPGGLVDAAVAIAGEFLPPGTTVMTMKGRDGKLVRDPYKTATRQRRPRQYPMAVIINGSSASASELVSGALQDLKRATLVGVKSFGKGSVQTILPVEGGAALRLTTAKYYTPSERVIHERGVPPDVEVVIPQSAEKAIFDLWKTSSSQAGDPMKLAAQPDEQLRKAAAVVVEKLAAPSSSKSSPGRPSAQPPVKGKAADPK